VADAHETDETRLCPTCRMPISILATRCRHCGENVGRPRKEEEKLTIHDLGGESRTTYTLSGNVMDALESFRAEELSAQEAQRREREAAASAGLFSRRSSSIKKGTEGEHISDSGLPELDTQSQGLAGISIESKPRSLTPAARKRPGAPTFTRKLFALGAVIAGLILLVLASDFAWARLQDFLERRRLGDQPIYESRALAMLSEGRPLIDALVEANDAVKLTDSRENREIAEEVRGRFVEEIEALLREDPFTQEGLNKASALAAKALACDKTRAIRDLSEGVEKEVASFKLVLTSVDVDNRTATFKLNNPYVAEQEQTVGEGQHVVDRFIVKDIKSTFVRLVDTKVEATGGYRTIIARRLAPVSGEKTR